MSEELIPKIAFFLAGDEARAGREFLDRQGEAGVRQLLSRIEADYTQAIQSIDLGGRDQARIGLIAYMLARAAGVTDPNGRQTLARLVEVGWLMARWYERD